MNFGYIFEHGDAVLVTTFLLLIAMSVASWYIIFWKLMKLRKEKAQLAHFRANLKTPDWPRHLTRIEGEGSAMALVRQASQLVPGLASLSAGEKKEVLSMHLSQSLDVIRAWMDRGLTLLASVGSSAPFIGLFGTVWGIYHALTRIAAEGNASLNVVAGPMGEALVATAVGLFAAIPAVLAYNAFVRINRLLVQDLRHIAEQMALYLSLEADEPADNNLRLVKKGK